MRRCFVRMGKAMLLLSVLSGAALYWLFYDNHVVTVAPALERVGDFAAFLGEDFDEALTYTALRKAETVGRPVGSAAWLADMEARTGKQLTPGKRGRRPLNG
jgi:putative transposase